MQRYWINFIKGGDPNGAGLHHWPSFTESAPKFMVLDADFQAGNLLDAAKIDLFESYASHGGTLRIL
jgi:para-nitrobenzyl esterase